MFATQFRTALRDKHFPTYIDFFMNILCIELLRPQKKSTTERCSSAVHSLSTAAMLTSETSL
jgi:hypothetical protein